MKNIYTRAAALLLCLVLALFALSCKKDEDENTDGAMDMRAVSSQELEGYATLGGYTGLSVTVGTDSKGEAVWKEIRENAKIIAYPEQQVNYYIAQIEAQYKYYAEQADMSYADMLKEFGATEESIRVEAQEMAIDDVIYELVRRAENIMLSEDEKESLFDKYVQKYVSDYGYTEQYVKENMSELIYESMLYDKTTEYLIKNNDFQ